MSKKIVIIKGTKEKLEVIKEDGKNTTIKNSKGQIYRVLSIFLEKVK